MRERERERERERAVDAKISKTTHKVEGSES